MNFFYVLMITAAVLAIKISSEDKAKENKQSFFENEYTVRTESCKQKDVSDERKNTPCKFNDGISYEDFTHIVKSSKKHIKRIKEILVDKAVVYCTVESQTGYSDWNFQVDFNDWGHLTGTYWKTSENSDSNIPKRFGDLISGAIQQLLYSKHINLPEYSDYIDSSNILETPLNLSYFEKSSFIKKLLSRKKQVLLTFDSCHLIREHIYFVISALKKNGFKNITSVPVKDIGKNSNNYPFEVAQITIDGVSSFKHGELFCIYAEIRILYHAKQEIKMPHTMRFFKNKNYIKVGDELESMGFSNIYERKINDLVTGWIKKNGSVEEVLVEINDKKIPINKNQLYEFDTKIIILYHTF